MEGRTLEEGGVSKTGKSCRNSHTGERVVLRSGVMVGCRGTVTNFEMVSRLVQ